MDVTQSYASGEDKSCPTATVTETEGAQKTHEDERTSTREPHRGGYALPKSFGKKLVHLTHHHGSAQVPKKTQYHGELFLRGDLIWS